MPQVDTTILAENIKFWENRYLNNQIQWHINEINPMLLKHLRTLIPTLASGESKTGSNPKKIFLPLCGKTKDIPFLLSLGLEVFGVESVASAIVELGEENELDIKFDPINSIYYSADGRLQIFCGDLFKCPIEKWGPFDCIWDRGSFIAIDYPLRELYVDVMKRALGDGTGHKFRYLLQTVRYDKNVCPGPPRAVNPEDISKLLNPWAKVEQLEMYVVPENSSMRQVSGNNGEEFYEVALLLTNLE